MLRFGAASLFPFVCAPLLAGGCAFLYDFPEEVVRGDGGTGGSGAGTATGGGGSGDGGSDGGGGCAPAAPAAEALVFDPRSDTEGTFIGAVIRHEGQVFVHGSFGGTLLGYPAEFPPNPTVVGYMVRIDDGSSDAAVLGSVTTCEETSGFIATLGATMVDDHPVAVGAIPAVDSQGGPTEVHFDDAGTGFACAMGGGFVLSSDDQEPASKVAHLARFRGVEAPDVKLSDGDHSILLDVAWSGADVVAMGIGYGQAWGAAFGTETEYRYHLVRFAPDADLTQLASVVVDGYPDATYFATDGVEASASVAVDEMGTAWATGAHCMPGVETCADASSWFLTRWPERQPATQVVAASQANATSFGAAVAVGADKIVIGGGYGGTLDGTALPATTAQIDPFVIAVSADDPTTTVWAWPGASSALDRSRYEAVLDVAVVTPGSCGAEGVVYVAGCTAGNGAGTRTCLRPYGDADKGGFLVKLDLATGAEISVQTFAADNPTNGLFLPTAMDADPTGVWVAFSLQGNATVPPLGAISGKPDKVEGKLIRFSP